MEILEILQSTFWSDINKLGVLILCFGLILASTKYMLTKKASPNTTPTCQVEFPDLPPELLVVIPEKLTEITDRIRFRCVCRSWRYAFTSLPLPPQTPWLILPSTDSSFNSYSLSENRIYSKIPLPCAGIICLYGSGSGWVFAIKEVPQLSFWIINPFAGTSISVSSPHPHSSLCNVNEITLIWDRSDSVIVAGCIGQPGIYYYRLGYDSWSKIHYLQDDNPNRIVYFCDKFYIMDYRGQVSVFDEDTLENISVIVCPDDVYSPHMFIFHGMLMLLVNMRHDFTNGFHAGFYKIYSPWGVVCNIRDHAIFVDDIHCMSVKVPEGSKLRGNCIYSVESKRVGDDAIFSIYVSEVGSTEDARLLRKMSISSSSGDIKDYVPTWILPNF